MSVSLGQFSAQLTQSGVLSVDELAAFENSLPPENRPKDAESLARALVQARRLTKYQAQAIYQGKGKALVFDEYVVLDKLGQGGMGVVYKAQHRRMERIVAVKMLSAAAMKTPQAVQRFYREVKAAAKLSHPNIVTAYDAREYQCSHGLVMEYVEGQDLGAMVSRCGALPIAQAVDFILQAARGLQYAHQQGVVHRDIKPANLLVDKNGTVKILDMGLARLQVTGDRVEEEGERLTASGQVMGTCDYMAPEQAMDTHHADARADIYSLGCTLYRLVTGQTPYGRETLVQILLAHQQAPIPSLCAARGEASPQLDAVFQKMVAKKAADRYQTMTEVIAELERCLGRPSPGTDGVGRREDGDESLLANLSFLGEAPSKNTATAKKTARRVEDTGTYHVERDTGPSLPTSSAPGAAPLVSASAQAPSAAVASRAAKPRKVQLPLAIAGGSLVLLVGAMVAWQIVIRVRQGDQETVIRVPEGSETTVSPTGEVAITLRAEGGRGKAEGKPVGAAGQRDRQAAVWALGLGGEVGITEPGDKGERLIQKAADLPSAPFHLMKVNLNKCPGVTDASLAILEGLTDLQHLSLKQTPITDAGMAHLGRLEGLKILSIEGCKITEAGLAQLRRLHDLEIIYVSDVTASGLGQLDLSKLRQLNVTGDKIGDEVIDQAKSLPQLNCLWLAGPAITDRGAEVLSGMRQLSNLYLVSAKITDAGLAHLVRMTGLKFLNLTRTSISDAGLEHLKGLTQLTDLILTQTKVTAAGVAGFQAALPKCRIQWDGTGPVASVPAGPKAKTPTRPVAKAPAAEKARQDQQGWAKRLGLPVEIANSAGIKLVLIPPGEFEMGSTREEIEASTNQARNTTGGNPPSGQPISGEGPRHRVKISRAFWLGKYAVTQKEYEAVMGWNPSAFSASGKAKAQGDTGRHPVETVSWDDAVEFCRQLSADPEETAARRTYRLPTEAEWEYACRAGTGTRWFAGDDEAAVAGAAWFETNSARTPHPVGQKRPNAWGLCDMHGNVSQWCADWYSVDYYRQSPSGDPGGPSTGALRAARGGSWSLPPMHGRSAHRQAFAPASRQPALGFRVVAEVKAAEGQAVSKSPSL